jgi:hypothetical protein
MLTLQVSNQANICGAIARGSGFQRRKRPVSSATIRWEVWQITRETLRYAHGLYRKDENNATTLSFYGTEPFAIALSRNVCSRSLYPAGISKTRSSPVITSILRVLS